MNEIDEANVSTRKKRRRSGFRYSSKKDLQRSRVRRETSKVGGIQLELVRKALSFPSEIVDTVHHDSVPGSSLQPFPDIVEEHEGDGIELTCSHDITFARSNIKFSNMSFSDDQSNLKVDGNSSPFQLGLFSFRFSDEV